MKEFINNRLWEIKCTYIDFKCFFTIIKHKICKSKIYGFLWRKFIHFTDEDYKKFKDEFKDYYYNA